MACICRRSQSMSGWVRVRRERYRPTLKASDSNGKATVGNMTYAADGLKDGPAELLFRPTDVVWSEEASKGVAATIQRVLDRPGSRRVLARTAGDTIVGGLGNDTLYVRSSSNITYGGGGTGNGRFQIVQRLDVRHDQALRVFFGFRALRSRTVGCWASCGYSADA